MWIFRAVVLLTAAFAGGCVVSKAPLAGLGEPVMPFASGTRLEIFERADAKAPWKQGEEKSVTLVAGADRIYRAVNEAGKAEDDAITFHTLGTDRYIVQAQFSAERFGFAVLQVQGGEGLVSTIQCKEIDPEIVKKAGMKMVADDCWLEDTADPVAFLKQIAGRPGVPLVKYVPVKKQ
jgi:hypothetical protein